MQTHFSKLAARGNRFFGTASLKARLQELIPEKQELITKIRKEQGDTVLGEVKANQVILGMRGIGGLLYETSKLDPIEGIRYRGHSLNEIMTDAPTAIAGGVASPEAVFWLLLTGEYPTEEQLKPFIKEMNERSQIPDSATELINSLPKEMHPMTQLSMGMLALQP